ncbi:insulin receptor substrate 2-A-like [Solea solea]|uniref:insulin receptor substrate 2-A-like n=1 Tax=Solea solea TaxID=90069 RepID=UPI00272BE3EF|nr:insulin receptor substrate 2-A-like [Solea solea]XP_058472408.1 insulin receptor substrate 2-A-like [Solea solea]XP_058472409.1 insulin receptor substrate 2-A-like [Solea solea]
MAEGHARCDNHRRSTPASSSSPLSSPCHSSTQTWPPASSPPQPRWMNGLQMGQDEDLEEDHVAVQRSSSRFYEELFCSSQSCGSLVPPVPLVPLAGALLASSRPQSDAVKQGYLGKMERSHRRYFVLREGSHIGPSRLEWYKSQEKFTAMQKSASKAALFGSSKQGVIYLRCCLGVSRTGSSRNGHTVALYARDQTMVLVVGDQQEQEAWYFAIKTLMEEERKDDEHGEGCDEDDDGYCTLPPAAFFKEVWPVSVKARGLGRSKSLTGETRLCLTATSLILVRVTTCSDLPSVPIPLLSVRRFGHLDGSFFVELGRSAPDGPGEIWMEARDQGNTAIAQQIHEAVREAVRALRALPDFSRSPTSNPSQPQAVVFSKRSRPKYRDKPLTARPPSSLLVQPPRNSDIQTSPAPAYENPCKPDRTLSDSTVSPLRAQRESSSSESTCSYKEKTTEQCGVETCEQGEEQQGGRGYMMMSPQGSHSSSLSLQDDYMTMASPPKCHWPPSSSTSSLLSKSFNSSASDSPVQTSHQPLWLLTSVQQPEMTINPALTTASPPSPAHSIVTSRPGCTRPVQTGPKSDTRQVSSETVPDQPAVRRSRLSSCLLSCLQAEERS